MRRNKEQGIYPIPNRAYFFVMSGLTLLYLFKIRLGLATDEVFMVNYGKLRVDGLKCITEVWDTLQMSGWVLYPFMAVYHKLMGGYDGVFLFSRVIYLALHLGVALYTYFTLRLFWNDKQAAAASVISYLYVFSFYVVGYKSILFWGSLLTVLLLLRFIQSGYMRYVIVGAFAFCGTVLCYPTAVILVIPFTLVLKKHSIAPKRSIIAFWSICIVCAAGTLLYCLTQMPLSSLLGIYGGVAASESRGGMGLVLRIAELLAIAITAEGVMWLFRKIFGTASRKFYLFITIFLWLALIGIILLKYETASASRFWYVFLLFFFMASSMIRHAELIAERMDLIKELFIHPTIWSIAAVVLGTNQELATVAYGSILGIIGITIVLFGDKYTAGYAGNLGKSLVLMFFICFLVFVKDQKTLYEVSHVFQHREELSEGPGKGIYVTEEAETEYWSVYRIAKKYVTSADKTLILSDTFPSIGIMAADAIEVVHCGAMPYADSPQLAKYCEYFPEYAPTVVLIDAEYVGDYEEWLSTAPFGMYLKKNYDTTPTVQDGRWIIVR